MGIVRVEISGSFGLVVDGAAVVVSRRQVRVLLAALAVTRGPVSSDVLAEILWGAELPLDPAASLRVVVSRARSALGDASDSLVYSSGCYELVAQCDALEFADGVPTDSVQRLREVLALWRGVPFAGLGESDWFGFERERLSRIRWAFTRRLVASLWVAGEFDEVERLGREVLDQDERDESMASFVAMACARVGRQAEALSVIDECRSSLRAAGLLVSGALADLEGDILRGGLDFVPPVFSAGTDALGAFVGRGAELAAIGMVIDAGRSVGVIGEAGIGKSALVDVVRERIAGRGERVVAVTAPVVADRPLHTLALLASEVLDVVVEAGGEVSAHHGGALARVIPEWESDVAVSDPPADRDDLVARLVDFIAASIPGTVVIVDDWHWIDSVSAQGIIGLIRTGVCPVVLASRPVAGTGSSSLLDVTTVVDEVVMVESLGDSDVYELINKDFPGVPATTAQTIATRAGGNPLFVRLLSDLVAEGTSSATGLPANVLVAVKRRLGVLSAAALQVVEHGAVLGHEFDIGVLTSWVGEPTKAGLDEAASAGIITVNETSGVGRFVHSLIADGTTQLLSPAQLVALHDEAGRILESVGASPAGFVAHCVAASDLDPQRAFDGCVAAGLQYINVFSWDDALKYVSHALELHERGLLANAAIHEALLIKGQALFALGQGDSYDTLLRCVNVAVEQSEPDVLVDAMTELCHHGSLVLIGQDPAPVLAALDLALAAPVSMARHARLQAATARLLAFSTNHVRGQTLYKQALARFDEIEDLPARRSIMRHGEHGLAHPQDHELACEFIDTLVEHGLDDPELVNHVRWFEFQRATINADIDTLSQAGEHSRRREESGPRTASYVLFGQTSGQSMQTHWVHSSIAVLAGDTERAEQHADQALQAGMAIVEARGDGFGRGSVLSGYGSLLLSIRSAQGRLGELRPVIDTAIASAPDLPAWRAALCAVAHAQGDTDTATAVLGQLTANDFADLIPDMTWTGAMWLLAAPAADLATQDVCELLYTLMLPYQDRMSFTGFASLGPMHIALAALATRLGRADDAQHHQQQAAAITKQLRTISLT